MKAVGIRELKARLSEYLRLVRTGEQVLVTDRGEVVAEMGPPRLPSRKSPAGIEQLVGAGLLSVGVANRPDAYPRLEPLVEPGIGAALLDEERNGR